MPDSGIWYFHARYNGKQIKRSLGTRDKSLATLKAIELVRAMTIKKFEINVLQGIYKAEPGEDTEAMLKVLDKLSAPKDQTTGQPFQSIRTESFEKVPHSLASSKSTLPKPKMTLLQILTKFFLLKSNLTAATRVSYEATTKEFTQFIKNPDIKDIGIQDVTSFQEALATRGNTPRTIDSKIGTIRSLFNFAIKQGLYSTNNPASGLNILSKKQKNSGGFGIFDNDEITQIFDSEYFKNQKIKDPNYYWATLLGLITGCRSSEITSLESQNIKKSGENIHFISIRDSKTTAGIREVPVPKTFFELGFDKFIEGKEGAVFKYQSRAGKGAGNAIGKKFSRHLEEVKVQRDKLVFHSLRKFFNDYLLKNKVPIEVRSQIIGHEIDSVNVQVYANKLDIIELSDNINIIQNKVLNLIRLGKS
jgi:site-specific recombinase XerD